MELRTEVVPGRPDPRLAGLVDGYVGYDTSGLPPGVHRGLPSRSLTFIISLDEPVEPLPVSGTGWPTAAQGFVAGLHERAVLIRQGSTERGIAVEVGPLAARPLFGVPAGELAGHIVELPDLLGPAGGRLIEALGNTGTWPERFAILDRFLCRQMATRPAVPSGELRHLWDELSAGTATMGEVATELGRSRQHLTRRFRREVGVTPQRFRQLARLERSVHLIRSAGATARFADVAAMAGYSDQAHLNRDWQQLVGCTPRRWWQAEGTG